MAALAWEEFVTACKDLERLAALIGEEWTWNQPYEEAGLGFLHKEDAVLLPCHCTNDGNAADGLEEGIEEEYDPACAVFQESNGMHLYSIDVVYSTGFAVPVLCFNATHPDGRLLPLEVVWRDLASKCDADSPEVLWSRVTQAEHPVTCCPIYRIHPCETQTVMKEVVEARGSQAALPAVEYLLSWLSVLGAVVGLKTRGLRQAYLSKLETTQ